MKRLKRIMALVIAMAMVLGMTSMAAFAAGETNNRTLDGTISVSGLEEGDTVEFYRVLKFDQDAGATGGWSNDTGFSLTNEQIQKMLALDSNGKPVDKTAVGYNANNYGIDETLAATIADWAEDATAKYSASTSPAVVIADNTATVTAPADGLYVAIIHPGKTGTVYNPVFVGADYSSTDGTNTWAVNLNDSYSPASMAKKGQVTLDKKATAQTKNNEDNSGDHKTVDSTEVPVVETVNVGDTVDFVVDTTVPEFANNYTKAVFKVSDTVSTGLKYNKDAKVYIVSTVEGAEVETELTAGDTTFAKTETDSSYVLDFKTSWLIGREAATKLRVKYTAEVTSEAPKSVNILDNTATVNYSNSPIDETGKGILKDETKHYTFDIDANLLGSDSYKNTEVVKVGLDSNGKEITETKTLDNGNTVGALQGAKFKLYVADSTSATKIKDETGTEMAASLYDNGIYKTSSEIVSDAFGRLTISGESTPGIRGLDAGTYYLVETEAPDGYIKAQNAVKIVINATITEKTVKEYTNDDGATYITETAYNALSADQKKNYVEVSYKVNTLDSYEVLINGKQTANYTMTNEKPNNGDQNANATSAVSEDGLIGAQGAGANADAGKITNTQGVELPSTGGIGTTIFYIVGTILVIGAGVVLVTRRRMDA